MVSRRQLAALISLPLLTGVSVGEAFLTPPQYFTSPLYWLGLLTFALMGAFLLGAKSKVVQKYTALSFGGLLIFLAVLAKKVPEAATFGFGFVALFIGIGLRILYWVSFQAKWSFCSTCQTSGWAVKKQGQWYCDKGHALLTVK